jgi:hypothetical protein
MISRTLRTSVVVLGVSTGLCSMAMAQYTPYQQYNPGQPPYQGYPNVQTYPNNPAPAAPASWSFNPYTSGLGPCPEGGRGLASCRDSINPTAGQPNYWVRCDVFVGMPPAQADTRCQQMALQRVYEQAYAQQAAIEQQVGQQAATRAGALSLPASAYEPVSVDYTTPSDNRKRRVTIKRLASYSEPASRQICDTFTRIDAELDSGASTAATARRCKGPDGAWRDA